MCKLFRLVPTATLSLVLLTLACSSDEPDPFVPDKFRGTYRAGDPSIVGGVKADSVEFTIVALGRYALYHYDYGGQSVDFCDSEGNILGVGTPRYGFYSVKYTSTNCDSVNGVSRGVFTAIYRRDSLWLTHPVDPGDPNIYEFALVRVK